VLRGCRFKSLDCLAYSWGLVLWMALVTVTNAQKLPLPLFADLRTHYPGYLHHGGHFRNHELLRMLGITTTNSLLLHDTSALRLSSTLNKIGGAHSLGTELIRLSKFGQDSISGFHNLQYIFLPIAYGPYLADKYGYPNISKLHQLDPIQTKHQFWGKQGILRVITYTSHGNQPKGHVALWDCNHFHQSKDWIAENNLLTVEFWESPDSNCTGQESTEGRGGAIRPGDSLQSHQGAHPLADQPFKERAKYIKAHLMPTNARHSSTKLRHRKLPRVPQR